MTFVALLAVFAVAFHEERAHVAAFCSLIDKLASHLELLGCKLNRIASFPLLRSLHHLLHLLHLVHGCLSSGIVSLESARLVTTRFAVKLLITTRFVVKLLRATYKHTILLFIWLALSRLLATAEWLV